MSAFFNLSLLSVLILTSHSAFALDEIPNDEGTLRSENRSRSQYVPPSNIKIFAGIIYDHFDYKEELRAPLKSTELGGNTGFTLGAEYKLGLGAGANSLKGKLDYIGGSTAYDGTFMSGAPVGDSHPNKIFNLEGDFVFNLVPNAYTANNWKGYVGLGTRSWNRGSSGGPGSYSEEYSWLYLPLGIRYETRLSEKLTAAVDGSLKLMFGGHIKANLSELDSSLNNPEMSLGSQAGYKLQVPLDYQFAEKFHVVFSPWFEYSAIGKSNSAEVLINGESTGRAVEEPDSKTYQYGGDLTLAFDI